MPENRGEFYLLETSIRGRMAAEAGSFLGCGVVGPVMVLPVPNLYFLAV